MTDEPKRTCELCGTEYPAASTALRCSALQGVTYCGGAILPAPIAEPPTVACLVCMDSGRVILTDHSDPQRRIYTAPCPRGCSKEKP